LFGTTTRKALRRMFFSYVGGI